MMLRTAASASLRSLHGRALARCASSLELPRHLPASAFEQHYEGSSAGGANLSDQLLQRLAAALTTPPKQAALGGAEARHEVHAKVAAPLLAAARLGPAAAGASGGALAELSACAQAALLSLAPKASGPISGLEEGRAELRLRGALLLAHGAAAGAPDAAAEAGAARAVATLASVRRLRTAGESGSYANFRATCGASSQYMAWLGLTGGAAAYRARRGVWLTDALHARPDVARDGSGPR